VKATGRIRNGDAPFWLESQTLRAAVVMRIEVSVLPPWHDLCTGPTSLHGTPEDIGP
jgi:hypothetical protein